MLNPLYDFVMLLHEEIVCLDKNKPAHVNALRFGALSGLELGQAWMKAEKTMDEKVLNVVAQGKEVRLFDIVEQANKLAGLHIFKPEMFLCTFYRWSESERFYLQGIRMGFKYVMDLVEGLGEHHSSTVATVYAEQYLGLVRSGIATIS